MRSDARFEDGSGAPLRLRAWDSDDLQVVASLVQDAVFPVAEIRWQPRRRRLALLLNRLRRERGRGSGRPERVQSVLAVEDVAAVRSRGLAKGGDAVCALLDLSWIPGNEGAGLLTLTLAGGGLVELAVEALEVTLTDVTRPYPAPSGRFPVHPG